jgi:prepilin-type processing-associated H-X9-DG protein
MKSAVEQRQRHCFTLVELLSALVIISLLIALLLPAIGAARRAARKASCANNLRQIGIGLQATAERTNGQFCTGAFDWSRDGAVTEVGWVADLVKSQIPVGNMLCPANPGEMSVTMQQLLTLTDTGTNCVDLRGSAPRVGLDGIGVSNPCRTILDQGIPAGSARSSIIANRVIKDFYNTNFTASWFMVRSSVTLDNSGNIASDNAACAPDLQGRNATQGPLRLSDLDRALAPASTIPFLADGALVAQVSESEIGDFASGSLLTANITSGPVMTETYAVPSFPTGTPQAGASGWYSTWSRKTRQSYREFGPVHGGLCNVLFADGSVQSIDDVNGDGLLNNGFPSGRGYTSPNVEAGRNLMMSAYSLRVKLRDD